MTVQVLRCSGQIIVYSGPSALPMAQADNRLLYNGKGSISTGFEVEYTSNGVRVVDKGHATVEEAIAHADLLPGEAEAQVFGWCIDHGRKDYGDGFCYDCLEEVTDVASQMRAYHEED